MKYEIFLARAKVYTLHDYPKKCNVFEVYVSYSKNYNLLSPWIYLYVYGIISIRWRHRRSNIYTLMASLLWRHHDQQTLCDFPLRESYRSKIYYYSHRLINDNISASWHKRDLCGENLNFNTNFIPRGISVHIFC